MDVVMAAAVHAIVHFNSKKKGEHKMNIFEFDKVIADAIERAIDPETGEVVSEVALEGLEELQMDRTEKIENVVAFHKDCKAMAEAIKAEAKALTARAKAYENKADSLKNYLESALNGEKFESPRCKISYRKSESISIDPDALIPYEYVKQREPEYDKTALKKALKEGIVIDGVTIVEKKNIQIK